MQRSGPPPAAAASPDDPASDDAVEDASCGAPPSPAVPLSSPDGGDGDVVPLDDELEAPPEDDAEELPPAAEDHPPSDAMPSATEPWLGPHPASTTAHPSHDALQHRSRRERIVDIGDSIGGVRDEASIPSSETSFPGDGL